MSRLISSKEKVRINKWKNKRITLELQFFFPPKIVESNVIGLMMWHIYIYTLRLPTYIYDNKKVISINS